MSQVEHQNVHQGGLFKTFEQSKPEVNHEQVNSLYKYCSTNHLQSDIISTSCSMQIMLRLIVPS